MSTTLSVLVRQVASSSPAFAATAILAADASAAINAEAEQAMDRHAPAFAHALAGRADERASMPALMYAMRELSRHDLGFGLGYLTTAFLAATNLWVAGDEAQRATLHGALTHGERVSIAYHESEHGNDIAANEATAERDGEDWLLSGTKDVINNIDRAGCVIVHARTGGLHPQRSHGLFLLGRDNLRSPTASVLPRRRTAGARTCRIGGISFSRHRVPGTCLLGAPDGGFEYALRAFQLSRTVLPGASLGCVENALLQAVSFVAGRRLYGGSLLDLPLVRRKIAGAAARLWSAHCLSHALAAAAHLVPGHLTFYSSIAKFWIPRTMQGVLRDLAGLMGAHGYLREGAGALFEKTYRDYPLVSFGHAGALLCQALAVPMLPRVLRGQGTPLDPAALHDPALPPLRTAGLRLGMPTGDPLLDGLDRVPALVRARSGLDTSMAELLCRSAKRVQAGRLALAQSLSGVETAEAGDDVVTYCKLLSAACVIFARVAPPSGAAEQDSAVTASLWACLDAADCAADPKLPAAVADLLAGDLAEAASSGLGLLPSPSGIDS